MILSPSTDAKQFVSDVSPRSKAIGGFSILQVLIPPCRSPQETLYLALDHLLFHGRGLRHTPSVEERNEGYESRFALSMPVGRLADNLRRSSAAQRVYSGTDEGMFCTMSYVRSFGTMTNKALMLNISARGENYLRASEA
jgi:hypothetical protein